MTRALLIAIAALCGAIIATALAPQPVPDSIDEPEAEPMPNNLFELQSLSMTVNGLRHVLQEEREVVRLWRARALTMPRPETRKN